MLFWKINANILLANVIKSVYWESVLWGRLGGRRKPQPHTCSWVRSALENFLFWRIFRWNIPLKWTSEDENVHKMSSSSYSLNWFPDNMVIEDRRESKVNAVTILLTNGQTIQEQTLPGESKASAAAELPYYRDRDVHWSTDRARTLSTAALVCSNCSAVWITLPEFHPCATSASFKPSSCCLTETGLPFDQGVEFKSKELHCKSKTTTPVKNWNKKKNIHTHNAQTLQLQSQILTSWQKEHWRSNQGKRENQIQKLSVCVVQSIFTESAKSVLVNSTSAFALTGPISTVSGKWLKHYSGEQHGTSASKRPKSKRSHIRDMCQGSHPSCITHDVSTALHRVGQEEAH